MLYANGIRYFLSSRYCTRKKWKKYFSQFLFTQKQMMGKKEIGSTYSFIVVCCQYWLSDVRLSPLSESLTEAVYWAGVTRGIDIEVIVIQLCQQSTFSAS